MSMFSRISDIVQANINAILDKAEDPEKVIRLIVQEMEEALVELRTITAQHLASKKGLHRRLESAQKQAGDWQAKAELAMDKNREELARSALQQKYLSEKQSAQLAAEMQQIDESLQGLQSDISRLQDKLKDARSRQKALETRQKSVSGRLRARQAADEQKIQKVVGRFEQYEYRIDDLEARLEAYDMVGSAEPLESEFDKMEREQYLDDALNALKSKANNKAA
ncbi:PspA/IM30 family protein [Lacimicrobium alkaliphilum]|uniref:Phage shock protein PspA n=1 Tax=Lacimicrobium alkaliphilum TaxID=1526571 RepID=A0ABQ1RMZ1_9ALTE|nr:PspA/IM30 family protein [Lacimicrobium alkaliphilum]GGD72930.1 phage shock protein PspA [Lacimicrobium alkaliphilum]